MVESPANRAAEPTDEAPVTVDPYTMRRRLCDDDGMVSDQLAPANAFAPGLTYLRQLNNLRAHTGLDPVAEPFTCTGSAHLAGAHIRCISPAHRQPDLNAGLTFSTEQVCASVSALSDAYDRGVMAGTDSAYRAGIDAGELWALGIARNCRDNATANLIAGHRAAWPDRVAWRDEADGERT